MAQWIFFTGKGGVGKTTLAAGTAVALADRGLRVEIHSLDPAHNLGDVMGTYVGSEPTRVSERLRAAEVDVDAWIETYLREIREEMKQTYRHLEAFNLGRLFDPMTAAPGVEEYALLRAVQAIAAAEEARGAEVVVFDLPPTCLAVRILSMPRISLAWIDRLNALRREILRKRAVVARIRGDRALDGPAGAPALSSEDDPVTKKLAGLGAGLADLAGRLRRPERTRVAVVVNPDELSLREAGRIRRDLEGREIPVSHLLVNRWTGESDWDEKIEQRLPGMERLVYPGVSPPPSGIEALRGMPAPLVDALVGAGFV